MTASALKVKKFTPAYVASVSSERPHEQYTIGPMLWHS
jgi:hypothetical protein